MKSIKQLREQYQFIAEKEDKEQRKLTALVRAGLFDAKKLPMLKRALEKGVEKMTPAEKRILIDLLDSLMNQVISNEPVYMKVKRNVQSMDEEVIAEITKKPVTISDVPSIVVLKRKAVRVYPGGQQVGLYYSQQLDKYVTIPFGEIGMTEEVLDEQRARTQYVRSSSRRRDDDDSYEDEMDRAINTNYGNLKSSQRKMLTPGGVATRIAMRGGSASQIATGAILASLLKKQKYKDLKQQQQSPERKKRIADKAAQTKAASSKPSAPSLPTVTASKNKPKISKKQIPIKNRAIKEAVILKLMEAREYGKADAALDAASFIPGPAGSVASLASAGASLSRGDLAGAALDVAGALPVVGYAAKAAKVAKAARAAKKAKSATKATDIATTTEKGTTKLTPADKNAARRAKIDKWEKSGKTKEWARDAKATRLGRLGRIGRRIGKGLASLGASGAEGGATPSSPSAKKPIESPFQSQLKTNITGPQYRMGGDAPVDPATARRYQKQAQGFYSQQNESVEVNLDGNIVEINSNMANKLVTVYESLNDNNKKKMIDMLMNEETQNKIVEFVTRY